MDTSAHVHPCPPRQCVQPANRGLLEMPMAEPWLGFSLELSSYLAPVEPGATQPSPTHVGTGVEAWASVPGQCWPLGLCSKDDGSLSPRSWGCRKRMKS